MEDVSYVTPSNEYDWIIFWKRKTDFDTIYLAISKRITIMCTQKRSHVAETKLRVANKTPLKNNEIASATIEGIILRFLF